MLENINLAFENIHILYLGWFVELNMNYPWVRLFKQKKKKKVLFTAYFQNFHDTDQRNLDKYDFPLSTPFNFKNTPSIIMVL